jgi:hypothetical protein
VTDHAHVQLWDTLVSSALVGSGRRPVVLPPAADAMGRLLGRLSAGDPEAALLAASAAVTLHRRAARLPGVGAMPVPDPCEADERPRCSARSGQHLGFMLKGQYPDLLPEWLEKTAGSGRNAPAEYLPELLNLGATKAELRERILAVAGRRGRWLAAQNNAWDYAAGDASDDAQWLTGARAVRLVQLQTLRRQDPARARDLVTSAWPNEPVHNRVAFITALKIGLSMESGCRWTTNRSWKAASTTAPKTCGRPPPACWPLCPSRGCASA